MGEAPAGGPEPSSGAAVGSADAPGIAGSVGGPAGLREPWADRGYLDSVCSALDGLTPAEAAGGAGAGGSVGRAVEAAGGAGAGGSVGRAVRVEAGLTDGEVDAAEARFGLRFPADLRALLQRGLPTGWDWPNWRDPDADDYVRWALGKPARAMEFDILNNDFWPEGWGRRPAREVDRVAVGLAALAEAPGLVPICGNRYVPAQPGTSGNPVFCFSQIIDTVCCGSDLADFLAGEFRLTRPAWATPVDRRRTIGFWSAIAVNPGERP